ncbi:MAG: peroxiredoxin [Methanobacteriota archaeon]|mgnify:FL=1|nr:MAG: peroxiredoxin [Euryarchaeota archaeon]|tara:strand:+ start:11050 stop:11508 length:459 start_codon:yes stop_codon:yes gene_type:complete
MSEEVSLLEAPDFTLPTHDSKEFRLSDHRGKWVILFFYARDGSPTCKRGCLSFKEQYDLFKSVNCEVVGISNDSIQTHKEFKELLDLPFPLLSDNEEVVRELYGVPSYLGKFPGKSSFLINPNGEIVHVYDWLFRPRRHVAKILSQLTKIKG